MSETRVQSSLPRFLRTSMAFVTMGHTCCKYCSRYAGKSVANELSSTSGAGMYSAFHSCMCSRAVQCSPSALSGTPLTRHPHQSSSDQCHRDPTASLCGTCCGSSCQWLQGQLRRWPASRKLLQQPRAPERIASASQGTESILWRSPLIVHVYATRTLVLAYHSFLLGLRTPNKL